MKIFIMETADVEKKCGGCNWQTCTFYAIGESKEQITSEIEAGDDEYGLGMCNACLVDMLVEGNYEIHQTRKDGS